MVLARFFREHVLKFSAVENARIWRNASYAVFVNKSTFW